MKTVKETKMLMGMNRIALPLTLSLSMIAGLAACGPMSQDPLEKYPLTSASRPVDDPNNLKRVDPPVREIVVTKEVPVEHKVYYPKEMEQNYAAAQLFQITTNQSLGFVAGVEAKIPFEVRMLQGDVDFSASIADMPGAEFTEVAAEGNKKSYVLSFKPAVDMIPGSSREQAGVLKINLAIKSIKADNADKEKRLKQAFDVVSKTKVFEYTLRRDYRNPKLEMVSFPVMVEEGSKQAFQVKVSAPGTYQGYQPELFISYDFKGLNGGLFENSGVPFIRPSSDKARIEKTGDGQWVFNYEVDSNLFAVPAQLDKNMKKIENAESVLLRVSFQVNSPTGSTSDVQVVQYKIVYKKVAAPVVAAAQPVAESTVTEKQ